jgi:hypothetical protein
MEGGFIKKLFDSIPKMVPANKQKITAMATHHLVTGRFWAVNGRF